MRRGLLIGALLPLCSCASISKERGHDEVATLVRDRTGQPTGWQEGTPDSEAVRTRVDELLKGGLSPGGATQIALLQNPTLQSTYEELGISQADLAQAGLLKNPAIGAHIAFPVASQGLNELQFNLVQDLLDLLVLPVRKSIAADQFAADIQRVAGHALDVVADVKKAFAMFQAAETNVETRQLLVESAQAQAELAAHQFDAGNVPKLAVVSARAGYEQLRLQLAKEEVELESRRQELNILLGLWGPRADWKLAGPLAEPPEREGALDDLETFALQQRLDVEAARRQAKLFARAVDLARSSRFVGSMNVGLDYHRDADGPRLMGPSLTLELPLFDQRQATIARLEAQQRQSEARLTALAVTARNDVRTARTRLQFARLTVDHYKKTLLPLRQRAVELAQQHYNGMLIGLPQLLSVKRDQVEASGQYVEALRDYWVARAELERAVGGRLQ